MRRRREELAAGLDAREAQGFLLLDWLPGECQVDFGQADFRVRGVVTRGHFLVVSFPHSNVGFAQVFWGETAEWIGNTYLDDSGRDSPASLNSTGDM